MTATISLDMKKCRLRIHKQTLHMMNDPEFIYIWVNPDDMAIAICSSENKNKDALKVPAGRNCEFYSTNLFEELKRTDLRLSDNCTYTIKGVVSQGKKISRFCILESMETNQSNMR